MDNIGVDQSLSNSALYENRCLENINKLCKSSAKFHDQQQYKAILEELIVSTPGKFIEKIHCQLINISLIKRQVQGNHSVNFLMF